MKTTEERKAEFNRIAAEAGERVKRLREIEARRVLAIQAERIRQRLELEREAKEQGIDLPPEDERGGPPTKLGSLLPQPKTA